MDEKHPNNIDPRPKRRRDKDNPYHIYTVGIETDCPHYYVSFTDSWGIYINIEIDKLLFDTFDRFELDDLSHANEVDNHYDLSTITEEMLSVRAIEQQESVEDTTINRSRYDVLYRAIFMLPEKQRRRLVLYYFKGLTYEQIAEMEGCKHTAIIKSVAKAVNSIQKFFSERGYNLPH